MKIQKDRLGEFSLDSSKSYDLVTRFGYMYLSLYSDQTPIDGEDGLTTYEIEAHTYIGPCSDAEVQTIHDRLQNGEFDYFVELAIAQEDYTNASEKQRISLLRLEQSDYREIKFVCALIQALADGQPLEYLQSMAQEFIAKYPGHLDNKEQLRNENRAASNIRQKGFPTLPF